MPKTISMLDQAINALNNVNDEGLALIKDFAHKLTSGESAKWLADGKKFLRAELPVNVQVDNVAYLKLISGGKKLTLKATTGKRTITRAKDTFRSYIDPDFKNWGLDVAGEVKPETLVQVFEQIKNGTYAQIFSGVSDNVDSLFFTEDQVIEFCETYDDWLGTDFWTHLPFKVGDKHFVAYVYVYPGGLRVYVDEFSLSGVWYAEGGYRFVFPQLDTSKS